MQRKPNSVIRRSLLCLAYLAFACRIVIPPGYMPAALDEGGPVVFCPAGLPAGAMSGTSHHHDDGQDTGDHQLAWEHCPLGAVFDADALAVDIAFHLASLRQAPPIEHSETSIVAATPRGFRSRAPPRLDSQT